MRRRYIPFRLPRGHSIWRVRRLSGYAGRSNYYHHADISAPTWHAALRAAKEERVTNWRWIDRYDTSDRDYHEYQYLYKVEPENAQLPSRPRRCPLRSRS